MATDKTLSAITTAAKNAVENRALKPVTMRVTRNKTVLEFTVSCWIASLVIREQMERAGWHVEEL